MWGSFKLHLKHLASESLNLFLFAWAFGIVLFMAVYIGAVGQVIHDQRVLNLVNTEDSELMIVSKDWWPTQVGFRMASQQLLFQNIEFSVSSSRAVELLDPQPNWKFEKVYQTKDRYYYVLVIANPPAVSTQHKLQFRDSKGQIIPREISIQPVADRIVIPEWPSPKYYLAGDNLLALVINRRYRLPQDYVPQDLVSLSDYAIKVWYPTTLRRAAAEQLNRMVRDIDTAGLDYLVTSGYRTYDQQLRVYNQKITLFKGDIAQADRVSARPGYSEHQLGTTIDITSPENRWQTTGFESTKLSNWLKQNAHNYGFVLPYATDTSAQEGFIYEPWHYRFIGVDNALLYKQSGLPLNDWLIRVNQQLGYVE